MTEAIFDHPEPWTEAEYLALGETSSRIELVDWGLWVSPAPNMPHQDISHILMTIFQPAARAAGLRAREAVNIRVGTNRILIPDIVVGPIKRLGQIAEAAEVKLVVEILSPSTASRDLHEKKHLYDQAKIEWYLIVDPDIPNYESINLFLHHRRDAGYVETSVAKYPETMSLDQPFLVNVDTATLLDF
ncbi:Uma2 family endonuclease [Actinoplanes sp. CA-131856]